MKKKILKTHLYTVTEFNNERNRNAMHFVVLFYRSDEPLIDRLRKAIRSYIASDAGIEIKKKNNGDFNWGDALAIPSGHWQKFDIVNIEFPNERGITVISNMTVDHDEDFEATR